MVVWHSLLVHALRPPGPHLHLALMVGGWEEEPHHCTLMFGVIIPRRIDLRLQEKSSLGLFVFYCVSHGLGKHSHKRIPTSYLPLSDTVFERKDTEQLAEHMVPKPCQLVVKPHVWSLPGLECMAQYNRACWARVTGTKTQTWISAF